MACQKEEWRRQMEINWEKVSSGKTVFLLYRQEKVNVATDVLKFNFVATRTRTRFLMNKYQY